MNQISDFGFNINTQTTERLPDYVELPDGNYTFKVAAAERKVSKKDPRSWYIRAEFHVVGGKFDGRKYFEMFNLGNVKEEVRARAMSDVVKLADAIGFVGNLSGFGPLFGKVFNAEIKQRNEKDADGNEQKRARIQKYLPLGAAGAAPIAPATVPAGFGQMANPTPAAAPAAAPAPQMTTAPSPASTAVPTDAPAPAPTAAPAVASGLPWGNAPAQ